MVNINPGLQKYSTEALYLKSPTTRKPFFGKPGSSHVLTTNGKTLVEIEVIYLAQKGSLHFTQSVLGFKRILSSIGRVPFKMLSLSQRKAPSTLVPSFSVFFNLHSLIQSDFIIFISPLSLITSTLID